MYWYQYDQLEYVDQTYITGKTAEWATSLWNIHWFWDMSRQELCLKLAAMSLIFNQVIELQ